MSLSLSLSLSPSYFCLSCPFCLISELLIFLPLLQNWLIRRKHKKSKSKLSVIETKIFIALIYYTIVGTVTLVDFVILTITEESRISEIEKHFACEARGSGSPCDRSKLEKNGDQWVDLITYALLGLIPVVNLIFIISWKGIKRALQEKLRKFGLLRKKTPKDIEMAARIEQRHNSSGTH